MKPQNKEELDSLIGHMKQSGASSQAMRAVVDDFRRTQMPMVSNVLSVAGPQIKQKKAEVAPVKAGIEKLQSTSPVVASTISTAGKAVQGVKMQEKEVQEGAIADATFALGDRSAAKKAVAEPSGFQRILSQVKGGAETTVEGAKQFGKGLVSPGLSPEEAFRETGAGFAKIVGGPLQAIFGPIMEVIKSAPGGEIVADVVSSPFQLLEFGIKKAYEAAGYDTESEEFQESILNPIMQSANVAALGLGPKAGKAGGELVKKTSNKVSELLEKARTAKYDKSVAEIKTNLTDFIKTNQAVQRKVDEIKQKGTDVVPILSDPSVFSLLKPEKGSLVVDAAVDFLQNRIDRAMEAKGKLLPLADKFANSVTSAELLQRTINNIKDQKFLLALELKKIREAEALLAPEPASMSLSYLDQVRAKARASAVDAKGALKSDSVYKAINDAARDLVFEYTDTLPIGQSGTFGSLNKLIKDNISAVEFLNKTLKGKKVKNARLGQLLNRVTGAVIGSALGPIGAIIGSEMAGLISAIVMDKQLGGAVKKSFIRKLLPDNPRIIQQAEALIDQGQSFAFPQLPAPKAGAFKKVEKSEKTIQLPSKGPSTIAAEEAANPNIKSPLLQGILKRAKKRSQ